MQLFEHRLILLTRVSTFSYNKYIRGKQMAAMNMSENRVELPVW